MNIQEKIAEEVKKNPIMIYMKGSPSFPQCGFSGAVVEIFKTLGVPFHAVDVLNEEGYRDGVKAFSNWPTVPQIYIGGKFIGGCDITRELYQSGELKKMVDAALPQA